MTHTHRHDHCKHAQIRYCSDCDRPYCLKCGREWGGWYYKQTYPWTWTIPNWSISGDIGNTSSAASTAMQATQTTACTHQNSIGAD